MVNTVSSYYHLTRDPVNKPTKYEMFSNRFKEMFYSVIFSYWNILPIPVGHRIEQNNTLIGRFLLAHLPSPDKYSLSQ